MHLILESPFDTIYDNFALEEHLLEHRQESYLLVYTNKDAVVLGRYQNPWRECNIKALQEGAFVLGRRITGGGAVYHDPGVVNLAFIRGTSDYKKDEHITLLLQTIKQHGVDSRWENGLDIMSGEKKVSGSAFTHKRKRCMHHVTILIDSNLAKLTHALHSHTPSILTSAIPSRRASVQNLRDKAKSLTPTRFTQSFIHNYQTFYNAKTTTLPHISLDPPLNQLRNKHQSPDWLWGRTPRFTLSLSYDLHPLEVIFTVQHAKVEVLELTGKYFTKPQQQQVIHALTGQAFNTQVLAQQLESLAKTDTALKKRMDSFTHWLKKQYF